MAIIVNIYSNDGQELLETFEFAGNIAITLVEEGFSWENTPPHGIVFFTPMQGDPEGIVSQKFFYYGQGYFMGLSEFPKSDHPDFTVDLPARINKSMNLYVVDGTLPVFVYYEGFENDDDIYNPNSGAILLLRGGETGVIQCANTIMPYNIHIRVPFQPSTPNAQVYLGSNTTSQTHIIEIPAEWTGVLECEGKLMTDNIYIRVSEPVEELGGSVWKRRNI